MNARKYSKLVREYPFLIDDIYQTSHSEAAKLYEQGFPSAQEILDGAKEKYNDLPPEKWKVYDDALAAQRKENKINHMPQKRMASYIQRHNRLAVACLILFLLLSFFTLVPAGRVLAMDIVRFFAQVFGNKIEVTVDPSIDTSYADDAYVEVKSHNELGDIGIEPFVLDIEWLVVDSVIYGVNQSEKTLLTIYIADDVIVYTVQHWGIETDFNVLSPTVYFEFELGDNQILHIYTDQSDGIISSRWVRSNDVISISTKSRDTLYKILECLKK